MSGKIVLVSLFSLFLAAAPLHADTPQTREITQLSGATITGNSLSVVYSTGGCQMPKTSYQLELVSKKTRKSGDYTLTNAVMKVRVFTEDTGPCDMLLFVHDSVDLNQLAKQDAARFGLDLRSPNTDVTVQFELPAVVGVTDLSSQ